MSKGAVNQVIQKAIGDAAFRRQLQSNPGKALAGFDLTKDERSAITSGDPAGLTALGVDQRMSKAFSVGGLAAMSKAQDPGGLAAASKAVSPDVTGLRTSAFIDEGGAASSAAIIDGDTSGGSVNATNLRRIEGDLNVSAAAAPGSGSAIRDAHDAFTSTGSSIRDAHDSAAYSARAEGADAGMTNLQRIEGDLNVSAAAAAPGSGSAIRDAHDAFTSTGSSIRDAHDSAAYSARAEGADAGMTNLQRIEGDLNVGSGSAIRDAHDAFTGSTGSSIRDAHDAVTGSTGSSIRDAHDAVTGTAFEPQDASLDLSQIDPGLVSNDTGAFVTDANVDPSSLGGPTTQDAGGNTISE